MGKPKNKSKGQDIDDLSDTEIQVEDKPETESKPATKQSKKDKKKKKKDDDWEDDVANELATLSLEANKGNRDIEEEVTANIVNKKEKKKKKKQKQEESEEEEEADDEIMPSYQKSKKQAAFSMLMMDDEGSADDMKSPSESEEEAKPVQKQEPTKKKKEKKKQKNKEEEDIDALLAEIDKPKEKSGKKSKKDKKREANEESMDTEKVNGTEKHEETDAVEKTEPKVVTMEDLENDDDDDRKKKRKKKGKDKDKKEDTADIAESEHVDKSEPKVVTMEDLDDGDDDKKKKKKKKGKDKEKNEEKDEEAESASVEKSEPKVVTMEDLENDDADEGKKKKKKNKGKDKDRTEENEDNENESAEKSEPKVVTMEDLEDDDEDDKKKKKKKKGKDKKADEDEGEGDGEEEDAGEGTMKSAAQKRKEKKEREKEKRKADKIKQAQKKEQEKPEEKKLDKEASEEKGKSPEDDKKPEARGEDKAGDEAEEEGKKKKKDKKKKGEKEEKKEEKKKKTKAPISALKEMLKKQKEEEERLQREEEERIRKEEEAIAAAIEKKRLEEERRQKRKAKEKEKRERLKAEGKLLTAAQKADRRKAEQMLEMMRAQGIKVPNKDDAEVEKRKRPVYGQVRRRNKKDQTEDSTAGDSGSREDTPTPTVEEDKPVATEEEVKVEEKKEAEEVAEEWDDDVKDDWDATSSEEEEESEEKESTPETETKVQIEIKSKEEVKKKEKEAEDESEEESDEDEDSDEEEEESESEEESETESESDDDLTPYQRAEIKIKKRHEDCESRRSVDNLRAPVVCVLGHVDTGKTKILDKLRRTNVQDGEAGGITQQIGATNVPKQAILDKTSMCKEFQKKELKLPGLLIIDTPGHESFSNLRSRGSSLCDIAILVIDIMHGLEPQTIESINLLKERKTPFVVALNKIDRLYQWKSNPNVDVVNTIKKQTPMCRNEFDERSQVAIVQLAEQGLNSALFYENKNPKEYISLVPTSAHSGDGMGNLLALICELTQTWLAKKVSYTEELHATVMEVKALPGLGTTIDVILVNGKLSEGDQIVIAGTEGPIVTQIRGLLMPQPMRELRVKAQYEHHKEVPAAQGVKIIGKDMEKALAGLPLYVAHNEDEVEYYKEELSTALKDVLSGIKLSERGVFVQASTLGSLEALLEFLRTSKIPYAGINIGPVHKKDIMKASIMLEHDSQWAVILAFDVKVERDAQEMADSLGVRIFTADIIYHLEDKFLKFREDLKRQKQEEFKHIAVFPCKLRVLPQFIFNQRDPIVVGVSVEAGIVKVGTPLCVPSKEFVEIGTISSIENNHKPQETARRGEEVCIKIENTSGDAPKLYGRHFDHTDLLVSKISRTSIDAVKEHFREDMTKQDWTLMVELKKTFQIL